MEKKSKKIVASVLVVVCIIVGLVVYFTRNKKSADSSLPILCNPDEKLPNTNQYRLNKNNKCVLYDCNPGFQIEDGNCVSSINKDCVPEVPETNVKKYKYNKKLECLPYECEKGFVIEETDRHCIAIPSPISEETLNLVMDTLEKEVAKPGRVFVNSADTDKDFNLKTMTSKFLQAGCTSSNITKCVTQFVDYCDNNPGESNFGLDCDQIVSNLGISCKNDSECQAPTKCKVTPDSFKLYCN